MEKIFEIDDCVLYGDKKGVIHGTIDKLEVEKLISTLVWHEMLTGTLEDAANLAKLGIMVCDTYQQHTEEEMKSLVNTKEEIFEILNAAWDAGKFTQVVVHVINRQGDWLEGLREAKNKFLE